MSISTSLTLNYQGVAMPQSPTPTNSVYGTAPGQTLRGKAGVSNTIISDGGGSTLYGGGSGDTFYVRDPDDIVIAAAGSGINTIVSWTSSYTLPANVQNLFVNSASGGTGVGNNLNNLLVAEGAADYTLVAGTGNDVLVGNASGNAADLGGSTTFILAKGGGYDVISNFDTATDLVRLTGYANLTSLTSITSAMTQVGANVVLTLDSTQTLTFDNEKISNFTASDFQASAYLPNMTLRFDDEFNSFTSSPTGAEGWMTTGGAGWRTLSGNNEAEYYSDSSVGANPFSDSNGVLTITASAGSNALGLPYNSGIITTEKSLNFEYGLVEVSAQLPSGAGLWPAIWLLPSNLSWPPEIDIMEQLGSDPSTIYVGTHSTSANIATTTPEYVGNTSTGFHTYAVDWEPSTITWYFDGTKIFQEATPSDMHQAMYLLINLAVGGVGSWPGAPTSSSEFPAKMLINSVQYYASSSSPSPTGTEVQAASAPVTIDGDTAVSTGTAPAISAITATPTSGDLTIGATVTFTVTFSGAVTVAGGTPTLALNDGGAATYKSGSGTSALTFTYTVAAGQNTSDLALASSNAFLLNGATVDGGTGTAAVLTAANGYAPAGTLQIDTTAPTITTIATAPASGSLSLGESVTLTVTFSSAVTVAGGTPILTLNDGGTAVYQSGSGTSTLTFVYTVGAGQNTSDLQLATTNAVLLKGATITDGAGNEAVLTAANGYNPGGTLQVDTTAPAISAISAITATPTSGDLTVGATVTFTVTFSGAVTVAGGTPTLALNDGGTATYKSGSGTSALTFTYTVAAGQNTSDLALASSNAFLLNGATIDGGTGTAAVLTAANGYAPAGTLQIDTTAPTVASVATSPATGNVTTGQVVTLTVTFSSAVIVAGGTPTLALNDGGTATYAAGSGTDALTFTYTVIAGQSTTDLALASSNAILLNGATIRDGAGNNAVLTGANGYNPTGTLEVGGAVAVQSLIVSGWGETATRASGTYAVTGSAGGARITLGAGNQSVTVTGVENIVTTATGNDTINLYGDNNTVVTGGGTSTINAFGSYENVTVGPTATGTTTIDVAGFDETVASTGTGNITLIGPTGNSTIALGNGNDTITLGGSGNTVTVGTGTSTINVGIGQGTVHAGGGADTIIATGWNNLLDAGPGMNFLHGGSGNDTFVLNGSGQGLDTITGFQTTNHDTLDLTRTLASVATGVDLTNVGNYITAATVGGNTTLYVDPTGGHGTPYAFAVLDGVSATVAQLVSNNDLKVP